MQYARLAALILCCASMFGCKRTVTHEHVVRFDYEAEDKRAAEQKKQRDALIKQQELDSDAVLAIHKQVLEKRRAWQNEETPKDHALAQKAFEIAQELVLTWAKSNTMETAALYRDQLESDPTIQKFLAAK